jgi:hypothetical protein
MAFDGLQKVVLYSRISALLNKKAGIRQQHRGGMNRPAVHLAQNCKWNCMDMTIMATLDNICLLLILLFYYKLFSVIQSSTCNSSRPPHSQTLFAICLFV